jgi:hypothetical protein
MICRTLPPRGQIVQLQAIVPQQQVKEPVRWHTKSPLVKRHKGHHVSLHGHGEHEVLWHAVGRKLHRRHEPLVRETLQVTLHNIGRGSVMFRHCLRRKEKKHSPNPGTSLFFSFSFFLLLLSLSFFSRVGKEVRRE